MRMNRLGAFLFLLPCVCPGMAAAQEIGTLESRSVSVEWDVGDWDGPLALTRVTDLLLGDGDEVYVAQPEYQQVWVLSEGGRLVRVIGRKGQGPGEFQHPKSLFWKGDSLAVWDRNSFRVSLFTAEGVFLRSFIAGVMSEEVGLLGGSSIVRIDGGIRVEDVISGRIKQRALQRQDLRSEETDTIAILSLENSRAQVHVGGLIQNTVQPFSSAPIWKAWPDGRGLVLVERSVAGLPRHPTFSVTVFDTLGATVIRTAVPFDPIHLDDGTIDWVIERRMVPTLAAVEAGLLPLSRQDVTPGAYREAFYLPEIHPPVEDVALGANGEIWLRRETRGDSDTVDWLVLDSSAEPVATIRLPRDLEVICPGEATVVGARRDEMDVFHVARFRVLRSGANGLRNRYAPNSAKTVPRWLDGDQR
jgi:hypothetical protein